MHQSLSLLLALAVPSCTARPSAADTLPQLRAAMEREVATPEQSVKNSEMADDVSRGRMLHGFTRDEVSERLGKGDPCHRHPLCRERGFEDDDWYYEIGRESASYTVRYRPALIVGFNRFGKVERTFVLRSAPSP